MNRRENPFFVNKASDFTDDDILAFWVDFPGGYSNIVNLSGQRAMMILGGKGSGKTHLLRYLSAPVQLKLANNEAERVLASKVIGVYYLCGGLDAHRFSGKGQNADVWRGVFQYSMDLTLLEACLDTIGLLIPPSDPGWCQVAQDVFALLSPRWSGAFSYEGLREFLAAERLSVDEQVNNAAMRRSLNISIRARPSVLIFRSMERACTHIAALRGCRVVLIVDELENLDEDQQRYVNSLVREQHPPISMRVGARLYGVRTLKTFSAGEPLRAGSEYERVHLDDYVRAKGVDKYLAFVSSLCVARLRTAGFHVPEHSSNVEQIRFMRSAFDEPGSTWSGEVEYAFARERFPQSGDRPWMLDLVRSLRDCNIGVSSEEVLSALALEQYPLLERLNVHLFYRVWADGRNLEQGAKAIHYQAKTYINSGGAEKGEYSEQIRRWRADLGAQIYRGCRKSVPYFGWEEIVSLSHDLPRNLLTILREIYNWSEFNEEAPFGEGLISCDAQSAGIRMAADWFLSDVAIEGSDGETLRGTVGRLGELLRTYRYAQKPSEVGVSQIAVDWSELNGECRRLIELMVNWSLLVEIRRGHRDKNDTARVDRKFQINRLLAAKYEVSTAKRGVLSLTAEEVACLFDSDDKGFRNLLARRGESLAPPFSRRGDGNSAAHRQLGLF